MFCTNYSCLQNPSLGGRGLPPPDHRSLYPLSSTEFVEPHHHEQNSWVRHCLDGRSYLCTADGAPDSLTPPTCAFYTLLNETQLTTVCHFLRLSLRSFNRPIPSATLPSHLMMATVSAVETLGHFRSSKQGTCSQTNKSHEWS